jgi:hypothetical protein
MLEKRREQLAAACCREKTRPLPPCSHVHGGDAKANSPVAPSPPPVRDARGSPARPKLLVCAAFVLRHASTSDRTPQPTSGQVADRNGHAALTIGRSIVPR